MGLDLNFKRAATYGPFRDTGSVLSRIAPCDCSRTLALPLLANMSINNELPPPPSPNSLVLGYPLQHQPSLKCGLKLAYTGPLK